MKRLKVREALEKVLDDIEIELGKTKRIKKTLLKTKKEVKGALEKLDQ